MMIKKAGKWPDFFIVSSCGKVKNLRFISQELIMFLAESLFRVAV
jgi:hypothetical protein